MTNLDYKHLLFIEPAGRVREPEQDDDITRIAREVFDKAKPGTAYLGWHTCACGEKSDSCDFVLPDGTVTNSLMVHYAQFHRGEIPRGEILILARSLGIATTEP